MRKPIVFMFSGQGSQFFQMAKALFDTVSTFREWMMELDHITRKISGRSPLDYIYDKAKSKGDKCDNFQYTHPAIFMTEYSLAMLMIENGIFPDLVLGSSLGEFTSIAVSKVLSVEDTLECLLNQVECIESHCPRGGMMAVLHNVELYEKMPLIRERSELVAVNYDSHFVVSGNNENLKLIADYLKGQDIIFQELPVLYAFHSSLIEPAGESYRMYLSKKRFAPPSIPIASCLYGKMALEIPFDYLWNIARGPIRFDRAIDLLEQSQGCIYLDLGPGSTLVNFAKRNIGTDSQSECVPVITLFDQDLRNLERAKNIISKNIN